MESGCAVDDAQWAVCTGDNRHDEDQAGDARRSTDRGRARDVLPAGDDGDSADPLRLCVQGLARLRGKDHPQPGHCRWRPARWLGRRDDGQADRGHVPGSAPGPGAEGRGERRPRLATRCGPARHLWPEECADRFWKPPQDVVGYLEADLGGVLGVDESVDRDLDQLAGGVDWHVDPLESLAPLAQELVELVGHQAGKPPQLGRRRSCIRAVAERPELLAFQVPETGGVGRDRGAELALHRTNALQTCDSDLASPAAAGVGVAQRARPVPAMPLLHRARLEVTAGEHRLERLVERVERNELASLVGRAVIEVLRKRLPIGTLVIGPAHCGAKSKPRVASYIGGPGPALPRAFVRCRSRAPGRGRRVPLRPAARSRTARGADRQSGEDRKSTRLNSSHDQISYAVFCLKKKKKKKNQELKKKNKKKNKK